MLSLSELWPKKYANDFAVNLRSNEIGAVITGFVEQSAAAGFHHLASASAEDRKQVIAAMMQRAAEWKQLGLDNFPVSTDGTEPADDAKEAGSGGSSFVNVDTAVTAIRNAVLAEVMQFWPDDAKKSTAEVFKTKPIGEVALFLVQSSADGGHNSLGGATKDQVNAVVAALMEDGGDALKKELEKSFK